RVSEEPRWEFGLSLLSYGRGEHPAGVKRATLRLEGKRGIRYHRGDVVEWYVNERRGLKQGFTLHAPPRRGLGSSGASGRALGAREETASGSTEPAYVALAADGDARPVIQPDGRSVAFLRAGEPFAIAHYSGLEVRDASGALLDSWMEVFEEGSLRGVRLVFDDSAAAYPVEIDPLVTTPSWSVEGNQDRAGLGFSVANAGDVNGDGFEDVLVGAPYYDAGETALNSGRAYLFLGSSAGLSPAPAWFAEGEDVQDGFGTARNPASNARVGFAVAGVGDLDADGYADFAVGGKGNARVYVYRGSPLGPAPLSDRVWSGFPERETGTSIAAVGDVNGDGCADFAFSEPANNFDSVFVVYGAGRPGSEHGCDFESDTGLREGSGTPSPYADRLGPADDERFGDRVAGNVDINCDGYDDVIVGQPKYATNDRGRVLIFLGWSDGLAQPGYNDDGPLVFPHVRVNGDFDGSTGANRFGSAITGARIDRDVAVADDDCPDQDDPYPDDVLIGSPNRDTGGNGAPYDVGAVYRFRGSSSIQIDPEDPRTPTFDPFVLQDGVEVLWAGERERGEFGRSIARLRWLPAYDARGQARDIEGYLVGEPGQSHSASDSSGRAYLFPGPLCPGDPPCAGEAIGLNATWKAEGREEDEYLGAAVAGSDVNGDRISDAVVGAAGTKFYEGEGQKPGRALVFNGVEPVTTELLGALLGGDAGALPIRDSFAWIGSETNGSFPPRETRSASSPALGAGSSPGSVLLSTGLAQDGGAGNTDWDRDGTPDEATVQLVLDVPERMRTLRFTTQYVTGGPTDDPRDIADIKYQYGLEKAVPDLNFSFDLMPRIEQRGRGSEHAAITHGLDVTDKDHVALQLVVEDKEDLDEAQNDSALVLSRVFFSEVALPDYLSDPEYDEFPPDNDGDGRADYVRNPVSNDITRTAGTFSHAMTLLDVPGKGMPFQLSITYSSERDPGRDENLGRKWSHSYYATVEEFSDSDDSDCPDLVYVWLGGGRVESFEEVNPEDRDSCEFAPFPGVFSELLDDGMPASSSPVYRHVTREKIESKFTAGSSPIYRLAERLDPNGQRMVLGYAGGQLEKVTDTRGEEFLFAYDDDSRLASVTTVGAQVRFGYGSLGDLISVTDPNGLETRFDYAEKGNLLQITDADGITQTRNEYEAFAGLGIDQVGDRVVAQFNGRSGDPGQHTEFRGDAHEVLLREGGRETNLYDVFGRRVAQRVLLEHGRDLAECKERPEAADPWCAVTSFEYDKDGNPVESRDPRGVLTRRSFDLLGNLVEQIKDAEDWDGDTYSDVTKMTYHPDFNGLEDRLVQRRDRPDQTTCDAESPSPEHCFIERRGYDDAGNLTAHYFVDEGGDELAKTVHEYYKVDDPHPGLLRFTYDGNCPGPECGVFEYDYDPLGYLAKETDPTGAVTTYANDNLGRRIAVTDARGSTARFTYDAGGRLLAQIDPFGSVVSYTYDAQGNPLTVTQELDPTDPGDDLLWSYVYTPTGMLEQSIAPKICADEDCNDPLYITTVLEYDGDDRLTAITDPLLRRTSFEYDAGDRLVSVTEDPASPEVDPTEVTAKYDSAGNRTSVIGPGGQETKLEYDALGRIITETDLSTTPVGTVSSTYDERGLQDSITNARGHTTTYDFDEASRLQQISFSGGGYASGVSVSHTLDGNGNQMSAVSSDPTRLASVTGRSFDRSNRLTSRTVELAPGVSKTLQYSYDEVGNLSMLTYSDGYEVAYEYDAMNRLTKVCAGGASCPQPETTEYAYDKAGNLVQVRRADGSQADYVFDEAGRLTSLSDGFPAGQTIYSVDYQLDAAGRRISASETAPLAAATSAASTSFKYNLGNQLLEPNGGAYAYDADGNMVTGTLQGVPLTFAYDERNQVVAAGADTFRYDADGNRVERAVGGLTRRYVYDPTSRHSRLLEEYDGSGNLVARYVYGTGLVSREAAGGTLSFYHFDTRGSTVALTDASGTVTDTYAYAPYGGVTRGGGSNNTPNPFKYNGRDGVVDDGNGLYYMRARYYAPELMRFVQKSPASRGDLMRSQSLNRYAYVEGNPISNVDPTGDVFEKDSTAEEVLWDVAIIAVVAAAVFVLAPFLGVGAIGTAIVGGIVALSGAYLMARYGPGEFVNPLTDFSGALDYWLDYTPVGLSYETLLFLKDNYLAEFEAYKAGAVLLYELGDAIFTGDSGGLGDAFGKHVDAQFNRVSEGLETGSQIVEFVIGLF
ncbi:MAG: FG-GAP repeat protein, partial [Deltaproteobacteria bacterium]|nr:FG-GAP repeat protein [Deltaproteobacteria bacterium]